MVENARRRKGCTVIRVEMKVRFRVSGSCCRWFWLAMIMSGRSQQDSTSSGDEIWSMPVQGVRYLCGWYVGINHCRLTVAIRRLYRVVLVHRDLGGDRRVTGRSMIVGRIIFNIVRG